jgi:hypothetical protein
MYHDFNSEQAAAIMTASMACKVLGPKDALKSALEAAVASVDERLSPPVEGQDRIVTPLLRELLQAFKDNVFPAILASVKGRNANEKTVRSTALAMVSLLDAFDRLDAIIDDSYETAEYAEEAA